MPLPRPRRRRAWPLLGVEHRESVEPQSCHTSASSSESLGAPASAASSSPSASLASAVPAGAAGTAGPEGGAARTAATPRTACMRRGLGGSGAAAAAAAGAPPAAALGGKRGVEMAARIGFAVAGTATGARTTSRGLAAGPLLPPPLASLMGRRQALQLPMVTPVAACSCWSSRVAARRSAASSCAARRTSAACGRRGRQGRSSGECCSTTLQCRAGADC